MPLRSTTTSARSKAHTRSRAQLVVAALLAFLIGACTTTERKPLGTLARPETPTINSLPRTSLPMPPIVSPGATSTGAAWTLADGRLARLSDHQGEVVVLDFYATWCAPCRDEVPHLASLQQRFGAQGLRIIGLNVGGEEDRAQVPAFVEQYGINYQLAYPTPEAIDLFMGGDSAIPQTLVFSRSGELLRHFTGYDDEVRRELERIIGEAVAAPRTEERSDE